MTVSFIMNYKNECKVHRFFFIILVTRYEYEVQGDWNPNIAAANCYSNSKGNL
jgi:hypothetical protein